MDGAEIVTVDPRGDLEEFGRKIGGPVSGHPADEVGAVHCVPRRSVNGCATRDGSCVDWSGDVVVVDKDTG